MALHRYSEIANWGARAQQAWSILTSYAPEHRTVWYSHLGRLMQSRIDKHGLTGPVLGQPLGNILFYCQYHGLPLLTSLVIDQKTGLPGGGFPLAPELVPAEQQKVFAYNWADIVAPTADEFEEARVLMTNGTNLQPSQLDPDAPFIIS
jgi:hypothetical protein